MSYFSQFPYIAYPSFEDKRQEVLVKNFLSRVAIKNSLTLENDKKSYYKYVIAEGETPDIVSDKFYGTPFLYWTILIVNNIFDMHYDWPLEYQRFNDYIINEYGSLEIAKTSYNYYIKPNKHSTSFIKVPKTLYDETAEYIDGVLVKYNESYYEEEVRDNELKRQINLIRKEHIDQFVERFAAEFE